MRVNLDQIEFYRGPSRPPPSTSANRLLPDHTRDHVPRYFQPSFPTGLSFHPGPGDVPLGESPPLAGTTHEWNIFDFEINNIYCPTWPDMSKEVEPAVIPNMPATSDILLDHRSSTPASEPVPLTDLANETPCPARPDLLDHTPDMRGNDIPDTVPDANERETSRYLCGPCVTTPEQTSHVFSDPSVVGDCQQESTQPRLLTPGRSDSLHPGDYENDTDSSRTSDLGENPCSEANEALERAQDSSVAEKESAPSDPSASSTVRSTSEYSRVRMTPSSNISVRYPSIAVVVPSPSWKQGAIRKSKRAAAVVCNKRLRSGRGTSCYQDGDNLSYYTEQPCQKRKKRRPSIGPFRDPSDSSIPVSPHCSGTIQDIRGSAILTVESNSGMKPAYFFTFVPDPSPMLSRPHTAAVSGTQRPYTSDENALLVRLKEKEAMSWSEITTHFPGRNMSSLQVHYSTKLRRKTGSWSGKPKRRE